MTSRDIGTTDSLVMWDGLIHPLPVMFMKDKPPGGLRTMKPLRIIVEGQMSRVVAGGAEESYKQLECGTLSS